MHHDLEILERVDHLDREAWRRSTRITKHKASLTDGAAAVAARQSDLDQANATLKASQDREKAIQRRLGEYRQNRANGLRLLETGQGDPEAAQRQVDKCDVLIDDAETEMLEVLERQDPLHIAVAAAVEQLAEAQRSLAALEAAVPDQIAALRTELAQFNADKTAAFGDLPGEVKARYTAFRNKRKWAVAHVEGGMCQGCRMHVHPQIIADIRRGLVMSCNGCKRWIIPEAP